MYHVSLYLLTVIVVECRMQVNYLKSIIICHLIYNRYNAIHYGAIVDGPLCLEGRYGSGKEDAGL